VSVQNQRLPHTLARTLTHTRTHTNTHSHAHTLARTHARTHNYYLISTNTHAGHKHRTRCTGTHAVKNIADVQEHMQLKHRTDI
jgi:hypothetical protein